MSLIIEKSDPVVSLFLYRSCVCNAGREQHRDDDFQHAECSAIIVFGGLD